MRATTLILVLAIASCALSMCHAQAVVTDPSQVVNVPPAANVTGGGITQPTPTPDNPVALPPPSTGVVAPNITTNASAPTNTTSGPVLKKPIIYAPHNLRDPSEPLMGEPPKHLKRAKVTPHIYGGVVEFRKGRNGFGCPCKVRVPERFRYDTEFRDAPKKRKSRCSCGKKKQRKHRIPPVIAALYPAPPKKQKKKPCKAEKKKKRVEKIAPEYRERPKKEKKRPCKKDSKKKKATVEPEFYPSKPHKHRGVIVKQLKERRAERRQQQQAKKKSN